MSVRRRILAELREQGRGWLDPFATGRADAPHQPLGQHRLQGGTEQIGLHAHVDEAGDRTRRVVGVQRAQHEMTGERGLDRDLRRLEIPDFTDHEHVRILPQKRPQGRGKREPDGGIHGQLHDALDFIFHRILRREDLQLRVLMIRRQP